MIDPIDDFVMTLDSLSPGIKVSVDRADNPDGEAFIDIVAQGGSETVSYRPNLGFGFFERGPTFGERPAYFVGSAAAAAERIALIAAAPRMGESGAPASAQPKAPRAAAAAFKHLR